MSAPTNALQAGYELEDYVIDSVLGAGGFGITYKARDVHLNNWVAMKEYFPVEWAYRQADGLSVLATVQGQTARIDETLPDYEWGLSRFLDEARALACIKHPHVVRVNRYFRAHGTAYIVMDYEDGAPLSAVVADGQALSEGQVLHILNQVLPALQTVHETGYLHRDIKPSNLYFRNRDQGVMLIDFGAAREAVGRHSKSLTGLISPGYSPPEQYSPVGGRYGCWTDMYALGATVYRWISGNMPLDAPARFLGETLVPAVEVGAGRYHPRLLRAIDRAMELRPEDRYASVIDMQADLTDDDGNSLVAATPITVVQPPWSVRPPGMNTASGYNAALATPAAATTPAPATLAVDQRSKVPSRALPTASNPPPSATADWSVPVAPPGLPPQTTTTVLADQPDLAPMPEPVLVPSVSWRTRMYLAMGSAAAAALVGGTLTLNAWLNSYKDQSVNVPAAVVATPATLPAGAAIPLAGQPPTATQPSPMSLSTGQDLSSSTSYTPMPTPVEATGVLQQPSSAVTSPTGERLSTAFQPVEAVAPTGTTQALPDPAGTAAVGAASPAPGAATAALLNRTADTVPTDASSLPPTTATTPPDITTPAAAATATTTGDGAAAIPLPVPLPVPAAANLSPDNTSSPPPALPATDSAPPQAESAPTPERKRSTNRSNTAKSTTKNTDTKSTAGTSGTSGSTANTRKKPAAKKPPTRNTRTAERPEPAPRAAPAPRPAPRATSERRAAPAADNAGFNDR